MTVNLKSFRIALVSLFAMMATAIQAQTVTGNVKDATGEGVIGATVMEKGTKNGTITDMDGNFTIKVAKGKTLVFSYIGMKDKEVKVTGDGPINVTMQDDNTTLNDVVVIGYGTVRKKDLTGAVANVSSKQLKDLPVTSASEALTGKMAGVNITTTEGSPDADIKIRVRGGGSLSQDNSPLYIVDGFEVSSISDIAPSEIESIDVLKDASSTAIYGAKGANGVIIVTTKSGKEGKVAIDFGASWGWKKATKLTEVLDPYNYAMYQYELASGSQSKGYVSNYGSYEDIEVWKSREGSDFQDQIFGRTGNQQMYNVNVTGGTKALQFNVAYAHNRENSIMYGSGYVKNNLNAKLKYKMNKWITIDLNARLAHSNLDGLSGGADTNESNAANSIVANAARFRPVNPLNVVTDDEELESAGSIRKTPYERITSTDKLKKTFNQTYSAAVQWRPFKKWTFRTQFQYGKKKNDTEQVWLADAVTNSKYGSNGQPQAYFETADTWSWSNSNTITFEDRKFRGGHDNINVMIGQETKSSQEEDINDVFVAYNNDMGVDAIKDNRYAGTLYNHLATKGAKDNMVSFFGRINYTLNEKYLATVTMRADGSSKFGKGNKWGFFPSAALAWRLSDEAWLKDSKWVSNLKTRLSFGTAGNNRIPQMTQLLYSPADSGAKFPWFSQNGTDNRTDMMEIQSTKINENLKWETTITRNFGIDFGFWKGRLSGSVDLYWNTTKDLLMRAEIPGDNGYTTQYQNFGQTSNKGIELQFNAVLVDTKNFSLNFMGNIAYNQNKIDKLATGAEWQSSNWGGLAQYEDYSVVEGGKLGELWGYKMNGYYTCWTQNNPDGDLYFNNGKWLPVVGVDEKGKPITADPGAAGTDQSYKLFGGNLYPGAPKVQTDENGDAIKQRLGNTVAPVAGGFGINGTVLGNFDFNVFFNYSIGNKIVNGTKLALSYYSGSAKEYNLNGDFAIDNRYTWLDPETGMNLGRPSSSTQTAYPDDKLGDRLNEINANANIWNPAAATAMRLTDYAVEDASFLRLQQITIGYSLPKKLLKKFSCKGLRVYFTGSNLFCWTNYSGNDPEVDVSSKRNAMCPGVDYASYPKSRTYMFGVNLSF